MSIEQVQARYARELEGIQVEMEKLTERAAFLEKVIAELRGSAVGAPPRAKTGKAPKKEKAPKAKRGRKARGGITVADAIVQVVAAAPAPLRPKDIIPAAGKLSGGTPPSIRTQLNMLARTGRIEQLPFEGRGFLYGIPGAAPAKAEKKAPKRKKKAPAPSATAEPAPATAVEPPGDAPPTA